MLGLFFPYGVILQAVAILHFVRRRPDTFWLALARRLLETGDLTWSVLGLSGNIVTILLMATLLASLHWVLVVLHWPRP